MAIRLPKALTETHLIREGSEIELVEHKEGILMKPGQKSYDLNTLINGINRNNQHESIDTGAPTGREAW